MATGGIPAKGGEMLDTVEIFTPDMGGWEVAAWSLSKPDANHCAVALSDKDIMIVSGQASPSGTEVNLYDVTNGAYLALTPPPETPFKVRRQHSCFRDEDFVYVSSQPDGSEFEIWRLKIATREWESLPTPVWDENPPLQLGVVGGELTAFSSNEGVGVQVLRDGKWQPAQQQGWKFMSCSHCLELGQLAGLASDWLFTLVQQIM